MSTEKIPMWHGDFIADADTPGAFWCPGCGHYHPPEFKSWHPAGYPHPPGGYYCTFCIEAANG